MPRLTKLHLAVLALAASASLTLAQDNSAPPVGRPHPPRHAGGAPPNGQRQHGPPLVAALDVNHDGVIDASELANAPAALRALDKNGDGKLDASEFGRGPGNGPRPPHGPPPPRHSTTDSARTGLDTQAAPTPPPPPHLPPLLMALDVNQDGILDADEIANATAALKTLDKNSDGQLTPDEYRPPAPPHPPGSPDQAGPAPQEPTPDSP